MKKNTIDNEVWFKNCVNYPTKEFQSYSECEEDFIASVLPISLKPVWLVDDIASASVHYILHGNFPPNFYDFFNGNRRSNCSLPCSTIKIESRYLYTDKLHTNYSMIELSLPEIMSVSTTRFLRFSFSNTLSSVGGTMGLWLGLGLLQALQIVLECILTRIMKS